MAIVVVGSWIVIGLIIGFIASKIIKSSDSPGLGILVAMGSALVIGGGCSIIGGYGASVFAGRPVIFAVIGAVVGAIIWHAIRSRYASNEPQTVRRSY
jgi:uncharacterized membrane protein YeaQ/YmgE (transglycosylase-associated protein family)